MPNKNLTQTQIDKLVKSAQSNIAYRERYNIRKQLLIKKAIAAGIEVTESEIDEVLNKRK